MEPFWTVPPTLVAPRLTHDFDTDENGLVVPIHFATDLTGISTGGLRFSHRWGGRDYNGSERRPSRQRRQRRWHQSLRLHPPGAHHDRADALTRDGACWRPRQALELLSYYLNGRPLSAAGVRKRTGGFPPNSAVGCSVDGYSRDRLE